MSVVDGHAPLQPPDGVCQADQYHDAQDGATHRQQWPRLPAIPTRVETCELQSSCFKLNLLYLKLPSPFVCLFFCTCGSFDALHHSSIYLCDIEVLTESFITYTVVLTDITEISCGISDDRT